MGYSLPVVNFKIDYKKPAFYDDELTIETTIMQIPTVKSYLVITLTIPLELC